MSLFLFRPPQCSFLIIDVRGYCCCCTSIMFFCCFFWRVITSLSLSLSRCCGDSGPDSNRTGGNVTGVPIEVLVDIWETPLRGDFAGCPDVRPRPGHGPSSQYYWPPTTQTQTQAHTQTQTRGADHRPRPRRRGRN